MGKAVNIAAHRFGYGLRPNLPGVGDTASLLAAASAPFRMADDDWDARFGINQRLRAAAKARREGAENANDLRAESRRAFRQQTNRDRSWQFEQALRSETGFDARLAAFWSDHFTVAQRNQFSALLINHFYRTTIWPNLAGTFRDMLEAVALHPAMLLYLDQVRSFGPSSPAGLRQGRGLNENLAREILELHTLGVDASYSQDDVREFAELLTGLAHGRDGFVFRKTRVEPGAEHVLGKRYGGKAPSLDAIKDALADLAAHPETAEHLARKLVVHFIGAPAPEDLVSRMASAYLAADTSLMALYETMLDDPRAWSEDFQKVRTPFEFIVASLRALNVQPAEISGLPPSQLTQRLVQPMATMGQPMWRPGGPDGWPEEPDVWITPVTLAARVRWSAELIEKRNPDTDPRSFLAATLGELAPAELRFAVSGAEQRSEGLVLVLASPEFNRR